MIFSLVLISVLFIFSFSGNLQDNWGSNAGIIKTKVAEVKAEEPTLESSIQNPLFLEKYFDLDQDGKIEKITIYSTLGENIGDENTRIYLENSKELVLNLNGYFDGIQVHTMNIQGSQVLEVRTAAGHSIETTFYMHERGQLIVVPVSTAKPPYFYGIVSRNAPELKDLDGDGVLELFVYYRHFPPEKNKTVEVYKFNGHAFIKIQEYEEPTSEAYL